MLKKLLKVNINDENISPNPFQALRKMFEEQEVQFKKMFAGVDLSNKLDIYYTRLLTDLGWQ